MRQDKRKFEAEILDELKTSELDIDINEYSPKFMKFISLVQGSMGIVDSEGKDFLKTFPIAWNTDRTSYTIDTVSRSLNGWHFVTLVENVSVCIRMCDFANAMKSLHEVFMVNGILTEYLMKHLRKVYLEECGIASPKLSNLIFAITTKYENIIKDEAENSEESILGNNFQVVSYIWPDLCELIYQMCISAKSSLIPLIIENLSEFQSRNPESLKHAIFLFGKMMERHNPVYVDKGVQYNMKDVLLCPFSFDKSLGKINEEYMYFSNPETFNYPLDIENLLRGSKKIEFYFWWYLIDYAEKSKNLELSKIFRIMFILANKKSINLHYLLFCINLIFSDVNTELLTYELPEFDTNSWTEILHLGQVFSGDKEFHIYPKAISSKIKGLKISSEFFWISSFKRINMFEVSRNYENEMYFHIINRLLDSRKVR